MPAIVSQPADILPITELVEPRDVDQLCSIIDGARAGNAAVYPIGGATSLDFGLPATRPGIGVSLSRLNRVVDYPTRDMTITVQAGITMQALADELSGERQCVPLDISQAAKATIGGVVATNPVGPRCYALGTVRDYVIGIEAVGSDGRLFKAGGRVVKNVAGYDFCKLLTGSLGTLAIITQVTLRLQPIFSESVLMCCVLPTLEDVEDTLRGLVHSATTPAAIETLAGPMWSKVSALADAFSPKQDEYLLVVVLEGSAAEVEWMKQQLGREWQAQGVKQSHVLTGQDSVDAWHQIVEFPAEDEGALVLQTTCLPSQTVKLIEACQTVDPNCHMLAHAGNGVLFTRFDEFPEQGLAKVLTGHLQPIATAAGGNVVVLSNPSRTESTRQSVWGGINAPFKLMAQIKKQFDPTDILNPGRFVYP